MSKKLIALVLFVAMMIALVPTANAAVSYADVYPIVDVDTDVNAIWYGAQNYTKLDATTAANATAGKDFVVGNRILNGNNYGITVDIDAKVASGSQFKSQNINIEGYYSKLEPFYYSYLMYSGVKGVAIKVPINISIADKTQPSTVFTQVTDLTSATKYYYVNKGTHNEASVTVVGDEATAAQTFNANKFHTAATIATAGSHASLQAWIKDCANYNLAVYTAEVIYPKTVPADNMAYIDGYKGYVNTYDGGLYLTAVLGEADGTYTYKIWVDDSKYYTFTIKWDNLDNDVTTLDSIAVPSLSVIGIAGDQTDNFRAEYKNAYYKSVTKAVYTAGTGYRMFAQTADGYYGYVDGTLTLNIAAMTGSDRAQILNTKLGDAMVVKMKALDKNGYVYPQGTIVTFIGETNQNLYLGTSDKFVSVTGDASYLIDEAGCFNMTFTGIKEFAMFAGIQNWDDKFNADNITAATANNNVYLYTLVTNSDLLHNFALRLSYGSKYDMVYFGLKLQNVARTKSGITLVSDTITVKVGEEVGIPYIINDPMAMYGGVKGDWTYVNKNIAYGKDTDSAIVVGKAVGTTYAYVTDYADKVQLVVINVVAKDAATTTPVVTPVVDNGTKYVVTASRLNVRTGAGTSYSKVTKIDRNTVVYGSEVAGTTWIKINKCDTNTAAVGGFVAGKYLAEAE